MNTIFKLLLLFTVLIIGSSCQSLINFSSNTSGSSGSSAQLESIEVTGPANAFSYINRFKGIAVSEMKRAGVPASIKLAQGILESGYGSSELAKKANNHFGMKCGGNWSGKSFSLKGSCYRAYSDADLCYKEHSEFLKRKHYESLFKLKKTDYKGWARGLQKCGYATDSNYPNKLIELIERYKLYIFDQLV